MYWGFESVRQPFDEAWNEYQESQQGYPSSEPTYSSIGQRIAFYQEYLPLVRNNLWIGVGTGDLIQAGTPLFEDQPYNIPFHKPHNQLLETAVKFGLLGLVFFLSMWYLSLRNCYPGFRKLAYLFNLLLFISMMADSTLGTQAGITFFMGFNALFLVRPDEPLFIQKEESEAKSQRAKQKLWLN
jgi:O-antigen ligase